ncbi:oncostatin-M [Phodopus roborovskii]|uniref:Osm protein n=1 Tax=Phodopus roborovskii TaxID=109678 RepID=A0AAU9ZZN5_PHORO|nr:oncostatin-M [Phodopus roborovskii]CAH6990284.1 Osm [Phodopus roborovskii]
MQAQLPQRAVLSLALSLLFLSMARAARGCSSSSPQLLSQLQSQANITGDTGSLLEPYIHLQDLNTPTLRAACTEYPVAFPSEDTLRALSKPQFLNTVHATLGRVWHQLGALRQKFLKTRPFPALERARWNIQGIRNNVYCMAQLLNHPLEIPKPTQPGSGASMSTATTPSIFQTKLDSCRFLWSYHSFMGSVGRVFREWRDGSSRSRRHSPRHSLLRAWHKGASRIRPSRSSQSPMSRVQVPR